MPKIIERLPDDLIIKARELFEHYGYENVEMKQIAQETGIAVGTIYNYFSNKLELYLATMKYSFQELHKQLKEIINTSEEPVERLKLVLITYHRFVLNKQGFMEEALQIHVKQGKKPPKPQLFDNLENLYEATEKALISKTTSNSRKSKSFNKDHTKRLAVSLLMMVIALAKEFPGEEKNNQKFIKQYVDTIL